MINSSQKRHMRCWVTKIIYYLRAQTESQLTDPPALPCLAKVLWKRPITDTIPLASHSSVC